MEVQRGRRQTMKNEKRGLNPIYCFLSSRKHFSVVLIKIYFMHIEKSWDFFFRYFLIILISSHSRFLYKVISLIQHFHSSSIFFFFLFFISYFCCFFFLFSSSSTSRMRMNLYVILLK